MSIGYRTTKGEHSHSIPRRAPGVLCTPEPSTSLGRKGKKKKGGVPLSPQLRIRSCPGCGRTSNHSQCGQQTISFFLFFGTVCMEALYFDTDRGTKRKEEGSSALCAPDRSGKYRVRLINVPYRCPMEALCALGPPVRRRNLNGTSRATQVRRGIAEGGSTPRGLYPNHP